MYCQKCRSPLKLDSSLEDLNPAAFDLLVGSTGKSISRKSSKPASSQPSYPPERQDLYNQVSRRATSPVYKKTVPPHRHGQGTHPGASRQGKHDSPAMSFVMLSESQVGPPRPAISTNDDDRRLQNGADTTGKVEDDRTSSHQMERTARLFEIISARSDIDHPICSECTDSLVDGLQKRLQNATKERDAYISFLKNLNTSLPSQEDVKAAEKELETTLAAEAEAFQELLTLEKEKADVDNEIAALEEEARELDLQEEQFWRDRNAFALTLSEFQNEREALNMKYDHDSRQLERLQRTNVYNDTFCIGHDGHFGTINGLRLGRLSNPSVEWPEINAAWGQALLLLATLADKLGYQFQGYKLRPMGSTSRIDKIEYPALAQGEHTDSNSRTPNYPTALPAPKIRSLELYSSGDHPLTLIPWLHRSFDAGMVAFLECLRQLGSHVEHTTANLASASPRGGRPRPSLTPGLKLPYEIKRDKIGDTSIKLGFNQNDETWTRACKYTLTCCKFLLAHASNIAGAGSSGSPPFSGNVGTATGARER